MTHFEIMKLEDDLFFCGSGEEDDQPFGAKENQLINDSTSYSFVVSPDEKIQLNSRMRNEHSGDGSLLGTSRLILNSGYFSFRSSFVAKELVK